MTIFGLVVSALMILGTNAAHADIIRECESALENARADFTQINDLFNTGEVSRTEVSASKFRLLGVQLRCGNIEKSEYCSEAVSTAQEVVDGTTEEARFGMRTEKDIQAAKAQLSSAQSDCK